MSRRRSRFETLETRTLLAGDPILDNQPLVISEFVADSNASLLTRTRSAANDEFTGAPESPDWIELFNVSGKLFDVGGMHLTDDPSSPTKWRFPSGTSLGAGELLVVFASGADINDHSLDEKGYLHTNFRLSGEGEYLALTDSAGTVIHEFAPSFSPQRTDVSLAAPMDVRPLIDAEAPVEYLVPRDDSLEPQWRSGGFTDPNLIADATSPVGYDAGGGPGEPGETVGFEPIDRSSIDFSRGSIVVLEGTPFTEPGRVSEWTFYSEKTLTLTPLVLRASGDDFEIVGVGQTRTSDGSGAQTFAFDLQSGSDVVESAGYFFGYKDGDNQTDESGVVVYSRSETDLIRRYNGPLSGSVVAGNALTGGRQFDRAYSIQAVTQARLAGPINSDVQAPLSEASSLYVRYPFTVDQTDALQSLSLDVRYDDGFVAYLNGVEVARQNVPDTIQFDSTASSNRPLADANRFESFNISQSIGALNLGENVLAVHAFNDEKGGSEFLIDVQLQGVYLPSVAEMGFASAPTPGRINGVVFSGFVSEPAPSHGRGFYDEPFDLVMTTPGLPDAAIYFTTDGTAPTPGNPSATRYEQPLVISSTTNLRAAGFRDGMLPSRAITNTYIFTRDVVSQETLQAAVVEDPVWGPQMEDSLKALPTLSVVTAEPIQVEGEFATSAELIFPDGSPGFQVDAGIEVFGGTAVSFPKRSLRLSFKNIYGPSTFVYDLFEPDGVTEFDQLILRPGSHDTPFWDGAEGVGNYIRNRWANDRQIDMGHPAPRGRFVQLYLNGVYWGQYQLMERANAAFMAANFGGDKSDYDVLNAGTPIDGDDQAWKSLLAALDESYEAVQEYLDVVNYADYILMQFYGGNTVDWRSDSNWMAARRREPGAGFQFFAWDSDIILRTGADSDIVNFGGPGFLATLNGGLYQYADFRRLLAERAQMHFFDDGVFTDQKLRDQIDAFIDDLQLSVIAETARWGSGRYTPATWHAAVEWIKQTYAPLDGTSRTTTVIEQMRHAGLFPLSDRPTFLVDGQPLESEQVAAGDQLTMSSPNGTIYYTLDGSDPWQAHPTVSYTEFVHENSPVKVWVPADGSLQRDWQVAGFDDTDWISGSNGVGYDSSGELTSLIQFDIEQPMKDVNATAYLRFPFQVDDPSQLETLEFSMRYDDAFVAYLNGVEVARRNAPASLTWNSRARTAHANVEAIEFERFNLSRELELLTAGENVLAIHALNTEAVNVDLLMTPRLRGGVVTDIGLSNSAVPYTEPITVVEGAKIKARTIWGDQWSTLRQASVDSQPFPLRIAEVMYHPAEPTDAERAAGFTEDNDFEFIELVNISDATVSLSNVRLVQTTAGGQAEGVEIDFGATAIRQLAPGERVLAVEDQRAFALRYGNQLPVAGQWTGGLSNGSEQITLMIGDQIVQQFTYHDRWYAETDGDGASLEIIDPSNPDLSLWNRRDGWQPSSVLGGTPGRSSQDEPIVGDANRDGVFDADDLSLVFGLGEFQDGVPGNSTFEEGDWNGDGDFDSADLVLAFKAGTFAARVAAVGTQNARWAATRIVLSEINESATRNSLLGDWQPAQDPTVLEPSLTTRDWLFANLDDLSKPIV